mmetsp:Transcript_23305/g.73785  ORF Transcript_23305/g.73785 Transcript_23305/m.73785 type:complete len:360 (-) Transcript_23305:51-1130(-)
MPHKKGRARDVVPHREHRTSRRATKPPCLPLSGSAVPLQRTTTVSAVPEASEELLPLPLELWLRVARFGGVVELCRCETLGTSVCSAMVRHAGSLWEALCEAHFPSMSRSVRVSGGGSGGSPAILALSAPASPAALPASPGLGPIGGLTDDCPSLPEPALQASEGPPPIPDWKLLYARRWLRQRQWDLSRGRARSLSDSLGGLVPSAKACSACGEALSPSAGTFAWECASHPGDFLPRRSVPGRNLMHLDGGPASDCAPNAWSRAEVQQLQAFARAAWRSVGGSSGVRSHARNFRGGGHWAKGLGFKGWGSRGHWAEGLGARPRPGRLRDCVDGKVPCAWSCCGSEELISEGCEVGQHR